MELTECLKYIDPASLDYQTWVNVGMALKEEGCPCSVWDVLSVRFRRGKGEAYFSAYDGNLQEGRHNT